MKITRIKIKNWRNFKETEINNISDIVYILGPNASGKSNLLDAIRFLRDLAKTKGGGLQEAVDSRGGISKIRCLHARKDTEILIDVDIVGKNGAGWNYAIGFNLPGSGFASERRPFITKEIVYKLDKSGKKIKVLERPNNDDFEDAILRQQSHIEQINANKSFRELSDFMGSITYFHLVPQLLKFGDEISGRVLENDPFGQEFLQRVAATQERTRAARLKRIEKALQRIVPQMADLRFIKDEISGRPHLEIKFKHHWPRGAKQREDQFSDGTLRLISLLWLIQESSESPLLLEEPELSLNEAIVETIPVMLKNVRSKRNEKQIFITTHSYALLSNSGIDPDGIVVLEPSEDGSRARKPNETEDLALSSGLSAAEVILPSTRKPLKDLQMWLDI